MPKTIKKSAIGEKCKVRQSPIFVYYFPPHLRCVTTLPCEIFMFENCLLLLKKRYQNFFMQQFCAELLIYLARFVASKQPRPETELTTKSGA